MKELSRKIGFGKIDYLDQGRKNCKVEVEITLKPIKNAKGIVLAAGEEVMELTIGARVWNHIGSNIYCGGQCLDTIRPYIERDTPYKEEYKEIVRLWENYHLNGMHAGTPAQEKALRDAGLNGFASNYDQCCKYLLSIGLYKDTLPDGSTYEFGHGWLTEKIPEEDLVKIQAIIRDGMAGLEQIKERSKEELEKGASVVREAIEEPEMEIG